MKTTDSDYSTSKNKKRLTSNNKISLAKMSIPIKKAKKKKICPEFPLLTYKFQMLNIYNIRKYPVRPSFQFHVCSLSFT